jgi:hypothetical protein
MALFARLPTAKAEQCIDSWPEHRWYYRSIDWLLQQPLNKHIKNITLNEPLLKSIKEGGFINPFLFTDKWYPICGSQRLRAAMELTKKERQKTVVRVCRFTKPVWNPFFDWHDKAEGMKCAQVYFQMAEVAFKTIYCQDTDEKGQPMVYYEEYGNKLHWDVRDGPNAPKIQFK